MFNANYCHEHLSCHIEKVTKQRFVRIVSILAGSSVLASQKHIVPSEPQRYEEI